MSDFCTSFLLNTSKKIFAALYTEGFFCYNFYIKSNGNINHIMKKCKLTVMKKVEHADLIKKFENPIEHACDMREGMVFISNGWTRPEGLCLSAWESMSPFVLALACGGENIYDGWMKNKKSAMISCNDGFRPVSFYIEALDEDAD